MPITTVEVQSLPAETVLVSGKAKQRYRCELSIKGRAVQTVSGRFSELKSRFAKFMALDGINLAFPSRHMLNNFTTKESNVHQRAEELSSFLRLVLNQPDEGRLLLSQELWRGLDASSELTIALASIAAERKAHADAKRAALVERRQIREQEQRANCEHAQAFNSIEACSSLPTGVPASLTFSKAQVFQLQNPWCWGDGITRGPGGQDWFRTCESNQLICGELAKKANFVISTMRGEPLLLLQDTEHSDLKEYNLFRMDPRCPKHAIHACRITRKWHSKLLGIPAEYHVKLTPATQRVGRLICQGNWPSDMSLFDKEAIQARVIKRDLLCSRQYEVTIAAGVDCLLFLGIVCAIDRIHYEVSGRSSY